MSASRTAITKVPTPAQALASTALAGCDFSDAHRGQTGRTAVPASTVVRTHNRFGRLYVATIMPFHRLLSRKMLARAMARLNAN